MSKPKKPTPFKAPATVRVTAKPHWTYGQAFVQGYTTWEIVWTVEGKEGKAQLPPEDLGVMMHLDLDVIVRVPKDCVGYHLRPGLGTDFREVFVPITAADRPEGNPTPDRVTKAKPKL